MRSQRPNIVLILADDMGFFGPGLLRLRDTDAQPGPAGGWRHPVHADVQLRALLPVARGAADRAEPAPGGHRPHDRRHTRAARVPGLPEARLRHGRAGAPGQRVPDVHVRQVARRRKPGRSRRARGVVAAQARVRPRLRDSGRLRQLLLLRQPVERRRDRRVGARLLLDGRDLGQRRQDDRGERRPRSALLPVRRVHGAPLATARAGGGRRAPRRQVPQGVGRAAHPPGTRR